MRYIFTNVIADGPVDFRRSLTAEGQPGIRECFMIIMDRDDKWTPVTEISEASAAGLNWYSRWTGEGAIVVGHSVEYHHSHLRAEMISRGIEPHDGLVKTICTMLSLADHGVKAGGKNGWPKFQEACDFFGITRAGRETAEDNARCLLQVFQGMERMGTVPEPKTWKDRHGS